MQTAGWVALRRIAPGRPLSYAEFAAASGSRAQCGPRHPSARANAPALFVPCHRVLRADGSLGGFAWGVDVKRRLLDREAAVASACTTVCIQPTPRYRLEGCRARVQSGPLTPLEEAMFKVAIAAKTASVLRSAWLPRPPFEG